MSTAVDRLMAQGKWVKKKLPDGRKLPRFVMPTPELQTKLQETLEKKIKKSLREGNWTLMYATQREHPLHSCLFRERLDRLVGWPFKTNERTDQSFERTRQEGYADVEKLAALKAARGTPYDVDAEKQKVDEQVEKTRKFWVRLWAEGIGTYRSMLREPSYWRVTSRYYNMFSTSPTLPPDPPPKPVYVKDGSDMVIGLWEDGAVDLWVRSSRVVAAA